MIEKILLVLRLVEVVVALLLVGVIMMQRSKSGGGLGAITGGATEEVFGSGATKALVKATLVLAIIFVANTLGMFVLQQQARAASNRSAVTGGAPAVSKVPATGEVLPPVPADKAPASSSAPAPKPADKAPASSSAPAPKPADKAPASSSAPAPKPAGN